LSSHGRFDGRDDYLRVDNTEMPATEVVNLILERFPLPILANDDPAA
jgi:hypothetical protein